jgi:hypothetical protein
VCRAVPSRATERHAWEVCLWTQRANPRGWGPGRGFGSGAVFEAPALVSGLEDLAVMGEAVEECRRHLGVAEDSGRTTSR